MSKHISVACIAGDGIGPEVVTEARHVLDTVAEVHGGLEISSTGTSHGDAGTTWSTG